MNVTENNKLDISVIIPIYNVEKFVEKCLRSLFAQTKTVGVEFVLVNDCTPDNSMAIAQRVIDEFPDISIKVINKECNAGLASARQSGVDVSEGEYIMHVDSDDWCELNMLEDLYASAKINNADIVTCDYYKNYPNRTSYKRSEIATTSEDCINGMLNFKVANSLWTKLIKRSLYLKPNVDFCISGVDMAEDSLASFKLVHFAEKINYVPNAYLHYVQHCTSMMQNTSIKDCVDKMKVIDEAERFFKEYNVYDKYKFGIISRKIDVKLAFIKVNRNDYLDIYPELIDYLFNSNVKLSIKKRIRIILITYKLQFVLYFFQDLKMAFKKVF